MKRLVYAIPLLLAWAWAAWAAQPAPLTTLREIHALSNAEASHVLPVSFEATVTYYSAYQKNLFVQDGNLAIYVQPTSETTLLPGDRVLIKGTTQPSFRPIVRAGSITLLHPGNLPKAAPVTYDELATAQKDCLLVKVRGIVQTVDPRRSGRTGKILMRLLTDGGPVDTEVDSNTPNVLQDLLDAEVEVTGPAAGRFDGKMQHTGNLIHVTSPANVKVIKRAKNSPWSVPVVPMDQVLIASHVKDLSRRIRVRGTITYYQPGNAVVLQNGAQSLWIGTQTTAPLRIGDRADASGFPDVHNGLLTLTNGEIQDEQTQMPIKPQPEEWPQLVSGQHLFDLVSIEAQVVTAVRGASQDEYALVSDGYMFSAIYRHSDIAGALLPSQFKQVPPGSRILVTGICLLNEAKPLAQGSPFNILLRSSDDIAVLEKPSWLSTRNLVYAVAVLMLIVIAVSAWGWTLRRRVLSQTAALSVRIAAEAEMERRMAQLEQRRSRILEAISGNQPLSGILDQIAQLISSYLEGAGCWCEWATGEITGTRPLEVARMRVASCTVTTQTGVVLGTILAAFPSDSSSGAQEAEALSMGAELATLAIETRHIYADLRHRSEFDLLTNIANRFSLERLLEAQIETSAEQGGMFGLVYIDLNEFKQVNDGFGHHVGDLYLQAVAARMKHQLRSVDTLARIGGDEFAAVVPVVRGRAELEEIADRLKGSFHEPYNFDGILVRGSASVGLALYPEDGSTKDSLLSAADAGMYMAKHSRQRAQRTSRDRAEQSMAVHRS